MEKKYFNENLDIDGTAEELYIQARNGYLDREDTLEKVADILYGEGLDEKGDAVMAFREELDDQPGEIPFGRIKADIHRDYVGFIVNEEPFGDDAVMYVSYDDRKDDVIVWLEGRGNYPRGNSFAMTRSKFESLSRKDFERECNEAWFYAQPLA